MTGEETFVEKNIDKWTKLEDYNNRIRKKNISSLTRSEVKEYTELFRIASHHLSYAKTYYTGSKSVDYLNQLMGMSHSYFYTRQKSVLHDILYYFSAGFPIAFRKYYKYFLASVGVFLIGVLFITLMSLQDISYMSYFLPDGIAESNNITGSLSDETWYYPIISSAIMTNNIRVCALTIAYGVIFGVGTVYILLFNGVSLGAVYAMVMLYGMDQQRFWSLILPHGFIELTAIFIGGAAGLVIGKSMLIPGDMTRRDSFVKGAKEAFYFVPGLTVMLIMAGLIEGFFTPLNIPDILKLIFAFLTLLFLVFYLWFCGRPLKSGNAAAKRTSFFRGSGRL